MVATILIKHVFKRYRINWAYTFTMFRECLCNIIFCVSSWLDKYDPPPEQISQKRPFLLGILSLIIDTLVEVYLGSIYHDAHPCCVVPESTLDVANITSGVTWRSVLLGHQQAQSFVWNGYVGWYLFSICTHHSVQNCNNWEEFFGFWLHREKLKSRLRSPLCVGNSGCTGIHLPSCPKFIWITISSPLLTVVKYCGCRYICQK